MSFNNEIKFEDAIVNHLTKLDNQWERDVFCHATEKELLENWADILFQNNKGIDRLNNCPLTDGEMNQIIEKIKELRTPLLLNGFINGKYISIIRENEADKLHFGKEISLKIYDKNEISAGQSRYQIVRQPKFPTKSKILSDRRGDIMLLINGMPVIHIELKRSGTPISKAYNQIEVYSKEGVFSGLFSLVQVFVAMTPEEMLYFANPGPDGKFNKDYYFNWADFDNNKINDWNRICTEFLSIPMAHELIGHYTVADDKDGVLKVLRSYQYQAVNAIADRVKRNKWSESTLYGGHIWHTTGSGKTMTSYKAAQIIASRKSADKVVFLVDRILLAEQSYDEYVGFSDATEIVNETEDTHKLMSLLKGDHQNETFIVTSIHKMSNIKGNSVVSEKDVEKINTKRIVFIIDECHRSTFGDMLRDIKRTFPKALFFGFSGTPIQEENKKKLSTTTDVFGSERHRYSIADGIRDKNVLGFDPSMVHIYDENDLRKAVALQKAKASSETEALADNMKSKKYYYFMDRTKVPMAGFYDSEGKYQKGIEDYVPSSQYETIEFKKAVVEHINKNFLRESRDKKFHSILATSSIGDAIKYYDLFKTMTKLKVVAIFDQSIDFDNATTALVKEQALERMLTDYNKIYRKTYKLANYAKYKEDVRLRLAHKDPYLFINRNPEDCIDIVIVVDQMLTGFDSKWVNTLYLDKMLEQENLVQAFSRTNRLFDESEKPFGIVKYFRYPNTMDRLKEEAFKNYSGDKMFGVFVSKLIDNLTQVNHYYEEINRLFVSQGINNFEKLPDDVVYKAKFASLFKNLIMHLKAAEIQGFVWEKLEETVNGKSVRVKVDYNTYLILVLRYKELSSTGNGGDGEDNVPFDIDIKITEIDTEVIDAEYMDNNFKKYLKLLQDDSSKESIEEALQELLKTFATLTSEQQMYANIFLHDIQRGDANFLEGYKLKDYIIDYQTRAKIDQIHKFATITGVNEILLREFMKIKRRDSNLNAYGKFDELTETIDIDIAKNYFETIENKSLKKHEIKLKTILLLKRFVLEGGFEI